MADRLSWLLELTDRVSGPAARIEKGLEHIRIQLKLMDIAAKTNALAKIEDPLKKQRAALQLQRDKLLASKMALDKTGESSKEFISRLHSLLHIAQIVGGALEKMGGIAFDVGRRIAGAIGFKEASMIGLSTFLGGKAEGVLSRMTSLAVRTGRSTEEIVGFAKSLSMAGVASEDLEPIIKRLAGLNNISAGAGDTVGRVLANISAAGKGTAGDIEALRGTAINPEKVYEDFAERMTGKRNRIAGKAIADALSTSPLGINKKVLSDIILSQADKLGAVTRGLQGGQTLEGRMEAVPKRIDQMFGMLANSRGVRAFKSVLENLAGLFDPESVAGKKTLSQLNRISDTISAALEPLTGEQGRKRMQDFFKDLSTLIDETIPRLVKLAEWTGKVFSFVAARSRDKTATERLSEIETSRAIAERLGIGTPFQQFQAPVFGQRPSPLALPPINVSVNVDARGATKDDAKHIGDVAAEAAMQKLTDGLVRLGIQGGTLKP